MRGRSSVDQLQPTAVRMQGYLTAEPFDEIYRRAAEAVENASCGAITVLPRPLSGV